MRAQRDQMDKRSEFVFIQMASAPATAQVPTNPFAARSERITSASFNNTVWGTRPTRTLRSARVAEVVRVPTWTCCIRSGMGAKSMDTVGSGVIPKDRAITSDVRVIRTVAMAEEMDAIAGVHTGANVIQPTLTSPRTDKDSSAVIIPNVTEVG